MIVSKAWRCERGVDFSLHFGRAETQEAEAGDVRLAGE